jgi:hypothetical protein
MKPKLDLGLCVTFLVLTQSAFAQIDGAQFGANLRTKYGPALPRETFTVRAGIEMIVDYSPNGHVCRIQLPPIGPSQDSRISNRQAIDEITLELVPISLRGNEVGRLMQAMGAASISTVEYENITIAEAFQGGRRTGVTISLKDKTCGLQAAH